MNVHVNLLYIDDYQIGFSLHYVVYGSHINIVSSFSFFPMYAIISLHYRGKF